jgi:AcrR family transcriptional regulator
VVTVAERAGGTRARIKEVALDLFTEHGYEQTSLREVAERLGVTKAALYYHFKSKDEIVHSFVEDRIDAMDDLIAWAREQPSGPESRRMILQRYADELDADQHQPIMRFFEQNQATLKTMPAGQMFRDRVLRLVHVLAGPEATTADQMRAAMAVFALQSSWFVIRDPGVTDKQRREVALDVAYEILDLIGRG